MPTAHATAAARTALHTLTALREVTSKKVEVWALNDAIDTAIREAEKILGETSAEAVDQEHGASDAPRIPFADRKTAILAELEVRAQDGKTVTYSELGEIVGMPATGPWKPLLDDIGAAELRGGRPDIAVLVVSEETGLPGWVQTCDDRTRIIRERNRVFEHHIRYGTDVRNG